MKKIHKMHILVLFLGLIFLNTGNCDESDCISKCWGSKYFEACRASCMAPQCKYVVCPCQYFGTTGQSSFLGSAGTESTTGVYYAICSTTVPEGKVRPNINTVIICQSLCSKYNVPGGVTYHLSTEEQPTCQATTSETNVVSCF